MFNFFKKTDNDCAIQNLIEYTTQLNNELNRMTVRQDLLEAHLNLEYFHGDKNKPHYRTKRNRNK